MLRISRTISQSAQIEHSLSRERLLTLLAGFFAIVAIVLTVVGLYAVLSYSVVRRTKEIGIRLALGARQLSIARLVVLDIMLMVALGLAVGIAGALFLVRFVTAFLFEVKPYSFTSLALPLACLFVGFALTTAPLVFRAARADPTDALR